MQFSNLLGDSVAIFLNNAIRGNDGSWIAIQTDKPSYYAGEVITGHVIVQNNGMRQCDKVLLKVSVMEKTYWDEEITRTIEEGEGEQKRHRTVYEHRDYHCNESILQEVVVVSQLPHMLMPGAYKYPFQYALAPGLPGVAKFRRESEAGDPAWRQAGRKLRTLGEITYELSAIFDVNGVFSRDLTCEQEIVVNPKFDWSKMSAAHGTTKAEVKLLCCIPRGPVELSASFDKAAYAAGETAQVAASIDNASETDVQRMVIKLMRFITLHDAQGRSKSMTDVVASAKYPGVPKKTQRKQDMPLPLSNSSGALLPGTSGRRVTISYRFDVECDITCAPDVEVHMPVVIYAPAPTVWGLAAMGLTLPPSLGLTLPAMPSVPVVGPAVVMPPVMPVVVPPVVVPQPPVVVQQQPAGYPAQPGYPMGPTPDMDPAKAMSMAAGMAVGTAAVAYGMAASMNAAAAAQAGMPPGSGPGAMPGQGYPPQQPGSPAGYPPQQPGAGYPPQQQPGYPQQPQPGAGYPPQQPGSPGGYPPQQQPAGYPPQQPGAGYPPQQQSGYPPQSPQGYPPQQSFGVPGATAVTPNPLNAVPQ